MPFNYFPDDSDEMQHLIPSAGYTPIEEDVVLPTPLPPVSEKEPEPTLAYRMEIACQREPFIQEIGGKLGFALATTKAEKAISQWSEVNHGQHCYVTCQVQEYEAKRLLMRWKQNPSATYNLLDVVPQPKDQVQVEEAFVPVRFAVQMGTQLGMPTEGFLYHFIDGTFVNEYRYQGGKSSLFQVTQSSDGAMNPEPATPFGSDFLLALWKRGGQVVSDQYVLYRETALDNDAMSNIDNAFLDQHGVKLDMAQIIPLTETTGQRKKYRVAQGDTLSSIANDNNLSLEQLLTLNPYWHDRRAELEEGDTLFLAPVSVYNHGNDVAYPALSVMMAKGLANASFLARKKSVFPVIKVAQASAETHMAVSLVRYAVDTRDAKGKAEHPIADTKTFPGGVFQSENVPYTLRQLRDGWCYALSQKPNEDTWQLEEYQVTLGELVQFEGDTAEARAKAKGKPTYGHLLCATERQYYLGYSVQRWTDRIADYYTSTPDARDEYLRKLDFASGAQHEADISQVEDYVSDVNEAQQADHSFSRSSATFDKASQNPSEFLSVLSPKSLLSYTYQVPTGLEQRFIALDDPLGDINDLYLQLLTPLLMTTPDDETHHKVVMAETVRAIARVQIPQDKMPDIQPEQLGEFEHALDISLEYHYFLQQMALLKDSPSTLADNQRNAVLSASQDAVQHYEEANATLQKFGFTDVEPYVDEYVERRRVHSQINWQGIDTFYPQYIQDQVTYYADVASA